MGAPSPTEQQGAETKTVSGEELLPSLVAVMKALPPPTARRVAMPVWLGAIAIWMAREFDVVQETSRSLTLSPAVVTIWARRAKVSFRLRRSDPMEVSETAKTALRSTGVSPVAYSILPPWKVWRRRPLASCSSSFSGSPSRPVGPPDVR